MLKRIRQALWLIEVLVVLVVIEILIGLVSPAEQRPYEVCLQLLIYTQIGPIRYCAQ